MSLAPLPSTSPQPYTGHCLCGGLRFEISGELEPIQVCHCGQCRQAQGGPFATNIPVAHQAFSWTSDTALLKHYESSPGKTRAFCGHCGSPMFSFRDSLPGVLRIRAGLIQQPLPVRPAFHAYVASKANWWTIQDDAPQYPEGYAPK